MFEISYLQSGRKADIEVLIMPISKQTKIRSADTAVLADLVDALVDAVISCIPILQLA